MTTSPSVRNKPIRLPITFALVSGLGLSACGTTNWQIDDVASTCVVTTIGGAIIGGIIGAAVTNKGQGVAAGAGIGLLAGGAVCAVVAILDDQDKERIKTAQMESAANAKAVSMSYVGKDGRKRQINIAKPVDVPPPAPSTLMPAPEGGTAEQAVAAGEQICRKSNGTISVEGVQNPMEIEQYFCRNSTGDWNPVIM